MNPLFNRRKFLLSSVLTAASLGLPKSLMALSEAKNGNSSNPDGPIVLSTWHFGLQANLEAWKILAAKGNALDAVEKGVMLVEADVDERSVGYGGRPDRDGIVTLDACIMDSSANIGAVAGLENIM